MYTFFPTKLSLLKNKEKLELANDTEQISTKLKKEVIRINKTNRIQHR